MGEVVRRFTGLGVAEGKTRMRVTGEGAYVFGRGEDEVWRADLCKEGNKMEQLFLTDDSNRGPVLDILVSSILEDSLLMLRYHNSINLSMDGIVLGRIGAERID